MSLEGCLSCCHLKYGPWALWDIRSLEDGVVYAGIFHVVLDVGMDAYTQLKPTWKPRAETPHAVVFGHHKPVSWEPERAYTEVSLFTCAPHLERPPLTESA